MVVFSLIYEIIVRKIKVCEMEPLDKIEKQIYKKLAYVYYVYIIITHTSGFYGSYSMI